MRNEVVHQTYKFAWGVPLIFEVEIPGYLSPS